MGISFGDPSIRDGMPRIASNYENARFNAWASVIGRKGCSNGRRSQWSIHIGLDLGSAQCSIVGPHFVDHSIEVRPMQIVPPTHTGKVLTAIVPVRATIARFDCPASGRLHFTS